MNNSLKNSARFILLLLIQVIILNEIPPIHQFITPYLYFIFILWLPFGTSRIVTTLLGFAIGYTLDMFTNTPGLHAAAASLIIGGIGGLMDTISVAEIVNASMGSIVVCTLAL